MKPITKNTLFYGDNLIILREHIPSEGVDLIYLDPPFNSSRNYNVMFKDEHGSESEARKASQKQDNGECTNKALEEN
jgi:adenine specific DNA methylase Mod